MKNLARVLRDRKLYRLILTYLVFGWGLLGVLLLYTDTLYDPTATRTVLTTSFYFTTQSNLFITIVSLLYLLKQEIKPWFKYVAFIGLVNIFMTGIIFHILLTPFMGGVSFLNHILHTINPILYVLFYFFIFKDHITQRKLWIGILYPLIYVALVFILIEPMFGDLLDSQLPNFVGARYVYPFLDPREYDRGFLGVLLFNFGIITPIILGITSLLILMKSQFEKKFFS
jgi:hypothetical protein